jgi:muramidase (phage lysozyme)
MSARVFALFGGAIAAGALWFTARGTGVTAASITESVSDAIDEITPAVEDAIGAGPAPQEVVAMSGEQNVQAFLSMIRYSEGTAGASGYMTLFGGGLFYDFSDHPRIRFYEKADEFIANGKKDFTTAAGAYQIVETTWDRLQRKLSLPDFSPASQDVAAIELIRGRGALAAVREGSFDAAVRKCGKEWASLPGSPYGQPVRTLAQVQTVYENAGGVIAA